MLDPMPTYAWCCFACGSSNVPATAICVVCQCPAKVTVGQLEEFRSALLSRGTPLTPRATHLHEPPEIGALAVLSPVFCVLTFGLWPWQLSDQQANREAASRRVQHEV